jgi:CubicO group peptidase (beta-lactamase class C family)
MQIVLLLALAQNITRLDGTKIPVAEAEAFARQTLEANQVTGTQIAVINKGRLVWSFAHGLRQKNPDLPMTPSTNTWAASITKGTFGVYVQQLVEREKFSLDTPIAAQLAQPLNTYKPYLESASEIVKDPRWARVTPRMMLNHTSGLHNAAAYEPDKKLKLHFEPGLRYSYSGEGLNLLQFLIEQKKGQPLDQLMDAAIFKPLGMANTGMIYRKEFDANVADRFNDKGEFIAKTRRFPARAGGNMSSSVEDLARLATAMLSGNLVNLKPLLKPTVQIRSATQFPLPLDKDEPTLPTFSNLAYGMAWGLLTHTKFGPAFFKEGHGDGAQNFMICFIRQKSCMILLTNSDNGEKAFRPLLEKILGNTVTPWAWHGYP